MFFSNKSSQKKRDLKVHLYTSFKKMKRQGDCEVNARAGVYFIRWRMDTTCHRSVRYVHTIAKCYSRFGSWLVFPVSRNNVFQVDTYRDASLHSLQPMVQGKNPLLASCKVLQEPQSIDNTLCGWHMSMHLFCQISPPMFTGKSLFRNTCGFQFEKFQGTIFFQYLVQVLTRTLLLCTNTCKH